MASKRYIYSRTLAVGEVQNINFGGTYFYVREADGPVRIGNDDEDGDIYEVGTGPIGPADDAFRKLKVTNAHTEPNRIEIVVGEGEFRDSRFSLVPGRYVGIPTYPAPTRLAVRPETSIPAASGIDLTGLWTVPDRIRKAIVVQNLDAASNIEIRVGGFVANVIPGSPIPVTHTLEVSGPVEIYNPNGAAVDVRISEIVVTG